MESFSFCYNCNINILFVQGKFILAILSDVIVLYFGRAKSLPIGFYAKITGRHMGHPHMFIFKQKRTIALEISPKAIVHLFALCPPSFLGTGGILRHLVHTPNLQKISFRVGDIEVANAEIKCDRRAAAIRSSWQRFRKNGNGSSQKTDHPCSVSLLRSLFSSSAPYRKTSETKISAIPVITLPKLPASPMLLTPCQTAAASETAIAIIGM